MIEVPLVDLSRQHAEIAEDVASEMAHVIGNSSFIQGTQVAAFESEFAGYCGVRNCVGVGSGTDALEFGLRALGIGRGDRVIVPVNSFIASALAVLRAGAEAVLVDCEPDSLLVDVERVSYALDKRVKAVMAVHLYGQMAPVEELMEACGDIPVIEDAAQAHGARRHGSRAGSRGIIAGTSFYPAKNLGAYGDAGAVLTNDDDLAKAVRKLGNWGSDRKYHHPVVGFNSRLDTLQAVVLRAKLARLEVWNESRREAARRYDHLLKPLDQVTRPTTAEGNLHVWHLYVIRVPRRDRVAAELKSLGIGVGIHYPTPMHLQGALAELGYHQGDFPVAEKAAAEVLSLPMFPGITPGEQEHVVASLQRTLLRVS